MNNISEENQKSLDEAMQQIKGMSAMLDRSIWRQVISMGIGSFFGSIVGAFIFLWWKTK